MMVVQQSILPLHSVVAAHHCHLVSAVSAHPFLHCWGSYYSSLTCIRANLVAVSTTSCCTFTLIPHPTPPTRTTLYLSITSVSFTHPPSMFHEINIELAGCMLTIFGCSYVSEVAVSDTLRHAPCPCGLELSFPL